MNFKGIDNIGNKEKIAIVVIGYNRLSSIQRLLGSLLNADYPGKDIPLVISIDCSGNEQLYGYVRSFDWPYGDKYVNIQETRLGLKNHIFQCAGLTEFFRAVILLEDDLFVSPSFYHYASDAVARYGDNDRIAEIALYRNNDNGYAGFPFEPMQNGADVFLWQDVCTWGEILTESMWKKFTKWRDEDCSESIIQNTDMPLQIKEWTRAWSKPYNAFVVSTKRHVLYPYVGVTTNYGDSGEHSNVSYINAQTSMMYGRKQYNMPDAAELVAYDLYTNNERLYEWLGLKREELCLDVYGQGRELNGRRYLLSPKNMPYKIVRSFGLTMRPIEMNVKYQVDGNGLFLYDTQTPAKCKKGKGYPFAFLRFFFNSVSVHHIWRYASLTFTNAIKRKLGR